MQDCPFLCAEKEMATERGRQVARTAQVSSAPRRTREQSQLEAEAIVARLHCCSYDTNM
jgi:hypothetical protein